MKPAFSTSQARRPFLLPFLQMAVPLTAAASLFVFRGEATDLNNPDLPLTFRILKDAAFLVLVFGPLFLMIVSNRLVLSVPVTVYMLIPIWMAVLMLLIGELKSTMEFTPLGQVRNMGMYYVGGGGMAVLAWRLGYQDTLFRIFRGLMAASVLLGLAFYVFATNPLLYTIHGRMIGTLGNPNFLGYLCFLWIVIIHASVGSTGRIGRTRMAEMALAVLGLVFSSSIAALLCYTAWLALTGVLYLTAVLPRNAGFQRLLVLQVIGGVLLVAGAFFLLRVIDPSVLTLLDKLRAISTGGSETGSIRASAYVRLFRELLDWRSMLLGQTSSRTFVEFDGSNAAIVYNYGLPFFGLWSAYFLLPVAAAARGWSVRVARATVTDYRVLLLALFILVSFAVEFWLQYVPEKYPTCVIIAWVMYYIVVNTVERNDAPDGSVG